MATRRCMSMETSDSKPCENEVDVESAFCGAGHLCVSRPADQAPRAPTAASSDLRPVEHVLESPCRPGSDLRSRSEPSCQARCS
jgi:hypothetical protein